MIILVGGPEILGLKSTLPDTGQWHICHSSLLTCFSIVFAVLLNHSVTLALPTLFLTPEKNALSADAYQPDLYL